MYYDTSYIILFILSSRAAINCHTVCCQTGAPQRNDVEVSTSVFLLPKRTWLLVALPPRHNNSSSMADNQHAVETPTFNHNNGPQYPAGSSHGFIPSFADAAKMVSAPYSCLVLETHRRHVGLAPMYMKRKRTGIQEELDAELLKYSERYYCTVAAVDPQHMRGSAGPCDVMCYIIINVMLPLNITLQYYLICSHHHVQYFSILSLQYYHATLPFIIMCSIFNILYIMCNTYSYHYYYYPFITIQLFPNSFC